MVMHSCTFGFSARYNTVNSMLDIASMSASVE